MPCNLCHFCTYWTAFKHITLLPLEGWQGATSRGNVFNNYLKSGGIESACRPLSFKLGNKSPVSLPRLDPASPPSQQRGWSTSRTTVGAYKYVFLKAKKHFQPSDFSILNHSISVSIQVLIFTLLFPFALTVKKLRTEFLCLVLKRMLSLCFLLELFSWLTPPPHYH